MSMSMVGNIHTAKQELDRFVEMGQTISFQGNAIVEELALTLASKDLNPEILQNLPGSMQRKIEKARIKVIPTEVHGGVQIYRDTSVFNHIHNAALLRYLIDALFLAWPRDHLTTFTSDESNPEQVVKYFGLDRDVTLLDEPTANALVITRFLRDHPENFTNFVTFCSPSGYHWRRMTWEKLGRFGLPTNALEPFCRAVTSAYKNGLTHNDFLFPILLIRIQKDHPDFVLEGKVPAKCLEDMKDEIYTKMHY